MVLSYDSSGTVWVKSPFLCPAGERRHSQYYGSSFVILTSSFFFFFPLRFGTLLVRSVSGASHTLTIETPTVWCLHLCPRKPACSNILLSAAKPLRCLYCLCFPQMSDWHQQTPWRSLIPVGSDTNTQVTADLMDWCVFVCVCVHLLLLMLRLSHHRGLPIFRGQKESLQKTLVCGTCGDASCKSIKPALKWCLPGCVTQIITEWEN